LLGLLVMMWQVERWWEGGWVSIRHPWSRWACPGFSQGAQRQQWWLRSSGGGVRKEHSRWSAGDLMSEFETTWHNFDVKTVRILRQHVWKKGQFTHFSTDFDKKNCRICRDCSTW
jgi:hypothetical protein